MNQNTTIADLSLFSCFPGLGLSRKSPRTKADAGPRHTGPQLVGKIFPSQFRSIQGALRGGLGINVEAWAGRDGKRTLFVSLPEGLTDRQLESAKFVVETMAS